MVETEVAALRSDVAEVKTDVKGLLVAVNALVTSSAVRDAVEAQHARSRASTGVWVRWVLPILFTVGNGVFTLASFLRSAP